MSEHAHAVNAAVTGLSALPGTARSFAATRAMTRFLRHDGLAFHALIEPAQDAVREALRATRSPVALVVHDWSMFGLRTHESKADRYRRSHADDLGYELASALVVDADDGRPLGPMEFRLRTAAGILSSRVGPVAMPPGHLDELAEVMTAAEQWGLGKSLVHVIDREADSVGHYRAWQARGRRFLVRADDSRTLTHGGRERTLAEVVADLAPCFRDAPGASGAAEVVAIRAGVGRVRVAEADVSLHKAARTTVPGVKTAGGRKKQVEVPGAPIALRLVVTRVVDGDGAVLAQWCLFTNVEPGLADAATVGRWYAWRWRVETFHKLLKSSGQNAEQWQQTDGGAFLRRLIVASMACLTVWHLQRDGTEAAAKLRRVLVRLSGRQMGHRVESTAPALLAGLERLLAIDDLVRTEDLAEILALARQVLPMLFRTG